MNNEPLPFNIPAIDNRRSALALYLGVNSENERDWDSIREVKTPDLADHEKLIAVSASVFEFENARYYVDHGSSALEADRVIAFNSNHWKIKKAPASLMGGCVSNVSRWPIKDPTQLPVALRKTNGYPYLSESFFPLWLEALRVSHKLLDVHEEWNGNETYYQDSFAADYIAALPDPQFGTSGIVYDGVTDPAVAHLHRNDQPAWQAFKAAKEGLKTAPRGAIALLCDQGRWHIAIHAGDGYVSDCRTMRSSGPKPAVREIQECLLSYEGYLARCHAKLERTILRNFARLRELNLQPGQMLRDVELLHKGKHRKMSFKIASISEAGYLSLTDGTLRGVGDRFNATVPASDISKDHVQVPAPKKVAAPVDLDTAPLF